MDHYPCSLRPDKKTGEYRELTNFIQVLVNKFPLANDHSLLGKRGRIFEHARQGKSDTSLRRLDQFRRLRHGHGGLKQPK